MKKFRDFAFALAALGVAFFFVSAGFYIMFMPL